MANHLDRGTLVCLITGDDDMPIGAVGEVLNGPDYMNDYDVLFPGHPCPVPPGIDWSCHRTWLVPVGNTPLAIGTLIHRNLEALLCDDM